MSHPSEGSVPEMEEKYRRPFFWIGLGLMGTVLLLAASTLISAYAARSVTDHGEARDRAHRVKGHLHTVYSAIKDVETSRRGYVLMGEEDYLAPYQSARETITAGFINLRNTLHPEDERHRDVDNLETLINERIALAEQSIALYRQQGSFTEEQRNISPLGQAAMNRIRESIDAIMLEKEQELEALWVLDQQKKRLSLIAIVVGQGLSILLLVVVFGFLWAEFRRRARLQRRIERAYQSRSATVARLTERSEQIARMGEMSDLLHVCHTSSEAYGVVGEYAPRLFSARAGAICLTAPSRDQVETDSKWGELLGHEEHFAPDCCWSLRRGVPHRFQLNEGDVACGHLEPSALPAATLCYPLVAQGETLGFVHLQYDVLPSEKSDEFRLVKTFVEQISLAIGNLRLREALKIQATRDALSGLYNRRFMQEALEMEFKRAARLEHGAVGVIIMDLDHFKSFNDNHGHAAGDTVIRAVGSFLSAQVRSGDLACRYGGEEFVLILPGADKEQTARRARHICDGVRALSLSHDGRDLGSLTFSLGVAVFPEDGADTTAVLNAADDALYLAKKQGRDRVVVTGVALEPSH